MGFQTRRAMAMTPDQIRHIRDVGDAMEASFIAQNNVPNLAGLLAHRERGRRVPDEAVDSPRRKKTPRMHPARAMRPRTSESGQEDVSTDSEEEAALHVARREDEHAPEEGEVSLVASYSPRHILGDTCLQVALDASRPPVKCGGEITLVGCFALNWVAALRSGPDKDGTSPP